MSRQCFLPRHEGTREICDRFARRGKIEQRREYENSHVRGNEALIMEKGVCSIFQTYLDNNNYCLPKQSSDGAGWVEEDLSRGGGGAGSEIHGRRVGGGEVGSHDLGFPQPLPAKYCPSCACVRACVCEVGLPSTTTKFPFALRANPKVDSATELQRLLITHISVSPPFFFFSFLSSRGPEY